MRYCMDCGALMGKKNSIYMYDTRTGRPVYMSTYTCPNKKWYSSAHETWSVLDVSGGNNASNQP